MILNRQRKVRVPRRALESFLRRVQEELGIGRGNVTVCLVSDTAIAQWNEAFRKKKGPTDVLSFPAGKGARARTLARKRLYTRAAEGTEKKRRRDSGRAGSYLGDIAIAPETARRYARKNRRALSQELRVLILHGVLHLVGYDHETDQGEMNRIELRLRRRFGLA